MNVYIYSFSYGERDKLGEVNTENMNENEFRNQHTTSC